MSGLITLSEAAISRIKDLVAKSLEPSLGLRIKVDNKGCAGLVYIVELACEVRDTDEVIENRGVKVFIDRDAAVFLVGTELDYQQNLVESSFIFRNPNEKWRCGCKKSFHV